ncbi:uncharacterized protein DS421_4g125480 [Arachis hypogaea]|nr:uncharacterized protein DS421_4g125480 [Arachis hypogaea]
MKTIDAYKASEKAQFGRREFILDNSFMPKPFCAITAIQFVETPMSNVFTSLFPHFICPLACLNVFFL